MNLKVYDMRNVCVALISAWCSVVFSSLSSRTTILEQVPVTTTAPTPASAVAGGSTAILSPAQTFALVTRKSDLDKAKNKLVAALNTEFAAFNAAAEVKAYHVATDNLTKAIAHQTEVQATYNTKRAAYLAKPGADQSLLTLETQVKTNQVMMPPYLAFLKKVNLKSSWDAVQSANVAVDKMTALQTNKWQAMSPVNQATEKNYNGRLARIQAAYDARASDLAATEK